MKRLYSEWVYQVLVAVGVSFLIPHGSEAATIEIKIDQEEPVVVNPPGVTNSNGIKIVLGSYSDPGGKWKVDWDLKLDTKIEDNIASSGKITLKNFTDSPIAALVQVSEPLASQIHGAKIGGSANVTLTAGGNGGSVVSNGNLPQAAALIDGEALQGVQSPTVFFAPFQMSASGASNSQTNTTFGLPFPANSLTVPDYLESYGFRYATVLSDGDTVSIGMNSFITGTIVENPPVEPPAGGDEDGNGEVNEPPQQGGDDEVGEPEEPAEPSEPSEPEVTPAPEEEPLPATAFSMQISKAAKKVAKGPLGNRAFLFLSHNGETTESGIIKLQLGSYNCELGAVSVGPIETTKVRIERRGLARKLGGRGQIHLLSGGVQSEQIASVRMRLTAPSLRRAAARKLTQKLKTSEGLATLCNSIVLQTFD